jgi:hypothetical protein
MALVLDSSISGEHSNSYITVAECDDYWGNHYSTTKADVWNGLNDAQKVSALIQACRVIETARFVSDSGNGYVEPQLYALNHQWIGYSPGQPVRANYAQCLQFPRNVDYDSTGSFYIPESIKMAQCEQAVYLITFDESTIGDRIQGMDLNSTRVGDVSIHNRFGGGKFSTYAPMALEYAKPFFLKSNVKAYRG